MANYINPHALVSTDWLADNLHQKNVVVLDATWHLPTLQKDAKVDYNYAHIEGALYFDIDAVSDAASKLPHMLPSAAEFSAVIGALGINNDSHVVVYDAYGLFSAARVWWMFRIFGHDKVSILNGGSLKWLAEGRAMDDANVTPSPTIFKAEFRPELVCNMDVILANIESKQSQVIDARARNRFYAKVPEPRPDLRSGHIPNSISLPFNFLLDENSKELLSMDVLSTKFDAENIDMARPIICSCGSGVTACVLAFGLYLLGKDDALIYDGSWTEWGGSVETPIDI